MQSLGRGPVCPRYVLRIIKANFKTARFCPAESDIFIPCRAITWPRAAAVHCGSCHELPPAVPFYWHPQVPLVGEVISCPLWKLPLAVPFHLAPPGAAGGRGYMRQSDQWWRRPTCHGENPSCKKGEASTAVPSTPAHRPYHTAHHPGGSSLPSRH